ncbi:hypothetical protein NM208_g6680 [Fusarium decemcellulare]|uniref:Uncharacterized protein n=1 Tax=Fusarium decemcellulare TaxID=57161 RepID=A0ACC1SC49_9HYPO|nr:hypothetical protein NM208_g6680 [Fusarium decemcellulare]
MRLTQLGAVVAPLLLTTCALDVIILGDTNRDGRVDVTGNSDIQGKATWSEDSGALFLASIGDTNQRCSQRITPETPDDQLDKCHDATDDIQRNPRYLAPLRTLPIASLRSSAKGFIHVTEELAEENVRIFVKTTDGWVFVGANYTFNAADLKSGLELGIDARDVRRPGGWDGRARVHFTVTDGTVNATDSVALRVSPILIHHHAQRAERVFATSGRENNSQGHFVDDLKHIVVEAEIAEGLFLFPQDIWTQDFFEPGYMSIPGPNGPIGLRVLIRSAQSTRLSGRQIFQHLRSSSVGAVQSLGAGGTTDSTGNLETIPPYVHRNRSYPAGRIIMGSQQGRQPIIFPFLEAQEAQVPLELDTSWLAVGHVDEFLQFLPVDNGRGWVLMLDDPMAGLDLLHKASAAGHGDVKAFSRPRFPHDPPHGSLGDDTIDDILRKTNFTDLNRYAAEHIEANMEILKKETGITDEEIIRVPALFYWFDEMGNASVASRNVVRQSDSVQKSLSIIQAAGPHGNMRRQVSPVEQVIAYYPGTINGLVLTDSQVISPSPWGPVINGKDILAEAVSAAYMKANFNVTFMDDWFSHHVGGGEVHCGSNSWRTFNVTWW